LGSTAGNANTAIGYQALQSFTGGNTTAVGYTSLASLTSGTVCTAVGSGAASSVTTANAVSAFGFLTLNKCNADQNNAFGYFADTQLTSGIGNCSFGSSSGCQDPSNNLNFYNSCFGYNAKTSGGDYNTYLGFNANSVSPITTNFSTALGYNSTPTASNQIMLGTASEYVQCPNYLNATNYITTLTQPQTENSTKVATTAFVKTAVSTVSVTDTSNNSTYYPTFVSASGSSVILRADITSSPLTYNPSTASLGIGKVASSPYILDVSGNVNAVSYNTSSDYRIKENVVSLDESFKVDQLRPVTYKNVHSGKQDIGLIAHELQEEYPYLVTGVKDGENLQSVNYIGLIGILIKEIQDLKERVRILELK
jgi:hypothetical protein